MSLSSKTSNGKIAQTLELRALVAPGVYFLIFCLIAVGNKLWQKNIILYGAIGAVLVVFGFLRFFSSWKSQKPTLLTFSVFGNSLTWGLFCFVILKADAFSASSFALLLATAGICSGTILTFTHSFKLSKIQLTNMLIPILLGLAVGGGKEGLFCGAMVAVYLSYMLFRAKAITQAFDEDLKKTQLISTQKNALEIALKNAMMAAEVKNEFLSMMSHEIRTPLNGIIGLSEVMAGDRSLNAKSREMIETVRDCGKNLQGIVNDLLDFSKIESGKIELEETDFDIKACLISSVKIFENLAFKKNIKLELKMAPDIPNFLRGDLNRIRQVLVNLISNSLKFTDRGHIVVNIKAERKSESDFEVFFYVSDSGIGIAESNLSKLFQVFSQVDASMARQYGGTGLGLAICKKLCVLMGGDIRVETELGRGSTFIFNIPLKLSLKNTQPDLSNPLNNIPLDTSYKPAGDSIRILVAEDNLVNQQVLLAYLAKIGNFKIEARVNGLETLAELEKNDYDLIFMDCQMPKMDGYEATRRIRQLETFRRIPIIAITAHALAGDREACLEAGMDDYLTKPVRPEALIQVMEKWLRTELKNKNSA